jgi:RNA polymerase sigma-70 factor (ECF subfamily)
MLKLGNSKPDEVTYAGLSSCSDEELMVHVCQGLGDALAVLFKRYQRLVFSVAMKVLRDLGEAEDLTQSAFMQIYRTAEVFDPSRGSAKVWILKHAYHLSLNRRRHLAIRQFYSSEEISEINELTPLLEPGEMTYPEKRHLVEQTLSTLNEVQKQVLEMVFFDGLTLKEIADKTRETPGNVRHHYYRGIDKLRARLAPTCEERVPAVRVEAANAEA